MKWLPIVEISSPLLVDVEHLEGQPALCCRIGWKRDIFQLCWIQHVIAWKFRMPAAASSQISTFEVRADG